jgi:hypothetical protein
MCVHTHMETLKHSFDDGPKLVLLYLWARGKKFSTKTHYFHVITGPLWSKFQTYFKKYLKKSHFILNRHNFWDLNFW